MFDCSFLGCGGCFRSPSGCEKASIDRVVAAGMFEATSAWITAAHGSESLLQKT